MESIGARLVKLRKSKKLSQQKVGAVIKVATASISQWESDQTVPNAINILGLVRLYETSLEYILEGRKYVQVDTLSEEEIDLIRRFRIGKSNERRLELALACQRIELEQGEALDFAGFQQAFGLSLSEYQSVNRVLASLKN
jgi:transcriptional regulator with XRE-family HTH domain